MAGQMWRIDGRPETFEHCGLSQTLRYLSSKDLTRIQQGVSVLDVIYSLLLSKHNWLCVAGASMKFPRQIFNLFDPDHVCQGHKLLQALRPHGDTRESVFLALEPLLTEVLSARRPCTCSFKMTWSFLIL